MLAHKIDLINPVNILAHRRKINNLFSMFVLTHFVFLQESIQKVPPLGTKTLQPHPHLSVCLHSLAV